MIQRIQSIFLLLASASAFALFAIPFGTTPEPVAESEIYMDGVYNIQDSMGLLVLFCIAGALALINIFMFKNRKTQLLVGRMAMVINIIGFILVIVFYYNNAAELQGINDQENYFGFSLPIIFLIFAILAQRAITKDDKLVRSSDRLR